MVLGIQMVLEIQLDLGFHMILEIQMDLGNQMVLENQMVCNSQLTQKSSVGGFYPLVRRLLSIFEWGKFLAFKFHEFTVQAMLYVV